MYKYIDIYQNKDEKITSLWEQISLPAGDVNVLQSMLVYCVFLDEHVNHEPQFLLHYQDKLTLQSGEYHVLVKTSVDFSLVQFLQPYFCFCIHFSLRTIHEVCNREFQKGKTN